MRSFLWRVVCAVACMSLSSASHAFELSLRTTEGDTLFFAPAGDTVGVELHVDSAGEPLIGVEVFVSFDSRLFTPLDASPDAGLQPALSAGLLSGVFADSVIAVDDSVSIVHYAEVDLSGAAISGLFASIEFEVIEARSGRTPFTVLVDTTGELRSQYAVPNQDGSSIDVPVPPDLVFQDTPPRFLEVPGYVIVEDNPFTLDLATLAVDDQTGAGSLSWEAVADVEGTSVGITGSLLSVTPLQNFHGSVGFTFAAIDPAGARGEAGATLTVTPENDPPEIDRQSLPDTLEVGAEAVELTVLAQDVEDLATQVTFAVLTAEPVTVSIAGAVLTVSVPDGWDETAFITIQVSDSEGAIDEVILPILGQPIVFSTGDFDRNGVVDFTDFLLFAGAFNEENPTFDLDGNGFVDFGDLIIFAASFSNG